LERASSLNHEVAHGILQPQSFEKKGEFSQHRCIGPLNEWIWAGQMVVFFVFGKKTLNGTPKVVDAFSQRILKKAISQK